MRNLTATICLMIAVLLGITGGGYTETSKMNTMFSKHPYLHYSGTNHGAESYHL
jgi:hypothetical protein